MLAQVKSTSFEWVESSALCQRDPTPRPSHSNISRFATHLPKYTFIKQCTYRHWWSIFWQQRLHTHLLYIISTQYSGWDAFFVSLNGFSLSVGKRLRPQTLTKAINSALYKWGNVSLNEWLESEPSLRSPIVLFVGVLCSCVLRLQCSSKTR